MPTDTKINAPKNVCSQKGSTCNSINPLLINIIIIAPKNNPKIDKEPPTKDVPPIIAIANDIISHELPIEG